MVKAALAMFILLLGHSAECAAAEPATAESAMERYRLRLAASQPDCTLRQSEITVCGRRPGPDPDRLPLPVQPLPGARVAGEPMDAVEAARLGTERCTPVGREAACTGTLPVLAVAVFIVKTAIKVARGDEP